MLPACFAFMSSAKVERLLNRGTTKQSVLAASVTMKSVSTFQSHPACNSVETMDIFTRQHRALTSISYYCRLLGSSHGADVDAQSTHSYQRGDSNNMRPWACWLCERRILSEPHGHSTQVRRHSDGHLQYSWHLGRWVCCAKTTYSVFTLDIWAPWQTFLLETGLAHAACSKMPATSLTQS